MDYITIKEPANDSFTEKKSRFIGYISPVQTNDEAVEFINSVKAANRKARHNVYAYTLRRDNITRYSDDGEPQGTGGPPVLDVIKKEGLTDVCIVVTRYFGGVLLGSSGLLRAYSRAAKLAVQKALKRFMCECVELDLVFDYSLYGTINMKLSEFEIKTVSSDFSDKVSLKILVRLCDKDRLISKITDAANANINISQSDVKYEDFA